MGDPSKFRKKFKTPFYPWDKTRIDNEKKLINTYGLKNKRELWKVKFMIKTFRKQARDLMGLSGEEQEKRTKALIAKLSGLGILGKDSSLDDVLDLEMENLLERKIQTLVFKKGMAKTSKEARQMILHGHVTINGKKHTSPSTLISLDDEKEIAYIGPSRKAVRAKKPKPSVEPEESETEEKVEPKPEGKAEEKPEEKVEEKPEEKPAEEPKTEENKEEHKPEEKVEETKEEVKR